MCACFGSVLWSERPCVHEEKERCVVDSGDGLVG